MSSPSSPEPPEERPSSTDYPPEGKPSKTSVGKIILYIFVGLIVTVIVGFGLLVGFCALSR